MSEQKWYCPNCGIDIIVRSNADQTDNECNDCNADLLAITPFILAMQKRIAELETQVYQGKALLTRYYDEVPLGHQPHMIAHVVDDYLKEQWE